MTEKKKGLSTFAWIAIGCGGLIIVGLVAVFGLGFFAFQKGKEMVTEATGSESFEDFVQDLQDNPAKVSAETMTSLSSCACAGLASRLDSSTASPSMAASTSG